MKLLGLFLVFLAIVSAEVTKLDSKNFDSLVPSSARGAMVKFFAPWCGHCKALAPEYEKFAGSFAQHHDLLIGEIDCDAEKELCRRFEVNGYPTLKFFPAGDFSHPVPYDGGRTADDLGKFITQKTGLRAKYVPSYVVELTESNFDEVVNKPGFYKIVKFTAPWCGHCQKLKPDFEAAASSFKPVDNVIFADVNAEKETALRERFDVKGFPTIKYFDAQGNASPYEGGRTPEDIIEFMNTRAGTERFRGGALKKDAGRISHLDTIASAFVFAEPEARKQIIEDATTKVNALPEKQKALGQFYLRVMRMIQEKGKDYPAKEVMRLSKMKEGNISYEKNDEFTRKINILATFALAARQ